ncbi:MAG: DUF996 domain-containing protein [Thermoproteus sp.]
MEAELARILAGVGAILAAVGPFGYGVVGIIGVVLLLVGLVSLADFYGDQAMRNDAVYWFIFAVIAVIVLAVAFSLGFISVGALMSGRLFTGGFGLVAFIVAVVLGWIFYLMSARRYRNVMSAMAKRSGENLFETAGTLYFWGAVLTIILVGVILLLIANILAGVAFLIMKTPTKTQ